MGGAASCPERERTEVDLFRYCAYGLNLASEVALPELEPGSGAVDLTIRQGRVEDPPEDFDERGCAAWLRGDSACHRLRDVGSVLVRGGNEIVVDPMPDVADEVVRLSVIGPGMALALEQRGALVLHGSAVAVEGRTVAFLGPHAAGKSTIAATLNALGHALATDDVCALLLDGDVPSLVPSYSQIKLWPDAVERFGRSPDELPLVHPKFAKRALRVAEGFAGQAVPLARAYVLTRGEAVEITRPAVQEAFKALLGNWYPLRFGADYFSKVEREPLFRRLSQVASRVPVRILARPVLVDGQGDGAREIERAIRADLAED